MVKVPIEFRDLFFSVQERIRLKIEHALLVSGAVETRGTDEGEAEFELRVWDAVSRYIASHSKQNWFEI